MKKVAIYVEGKTERIFLSELLQQVFDERKVQIEYYNTETYNKSQVDTIKTDEPKYYYFLIVDCTGDGQVKSKILEDFPGLFKENYSHIIGLRDLFNPQMKKMNIDNQKFINGINSGLPNVIPVKIYFAIQEIEAWFLAEEIHYQNISSTLTIEIVNSIAGIDIQKDSTEQIPHPSVVLDRIYKVGGRKKGYSKNEYIVKDIVNKLDFSNLYLAVRNRNSSLSELLSCLDGLIP